MQHLYKYGDRGIVRVIGVNLQQSTVDFNGYKYSNRELIQLTNVSFTLVP